MKRHPFSKHDSVEAFKRSVDFALLVRETWKYRDPNRLLKRFARAFPCSTCGLWKRAKVHR